MLDNWLIRSETKQDNGLIKIVVRYYKKQEEPLMKFWLPLSALNSKKGFYKIVDKRMREELKKIGITDIGNVVGTNYDLEKR